MNMPNQTDDTPTLKQLTAWYNKIMTKASKSHPLYDGTFFHWHIRDWSYIVERISPVGQDTYFLMMRNGPCCITVR